MRLAVYSGASVALATGVFLKALHQRPNFYSACVYLSQSSASLMILTNLCLLVAGYLLFSLQRLLYGSLRPIETEQLYEKAWFAITETCLAMTIFRGALGGWFLVMFVALLVGKVWAWIGEGRVEFLEQQPPSNPRLFHARLASSLGLSLLFNAYMLEYCVSTVLEQARPDMMVMFGFEFAVLTILSSSTAIRYIIALIELYVTHQQTKAKIEESRAEIRAAREEAIRQHQQLGHSGMPANLPDENDVNELELDVPGWEDKGRWMFYLDLLTDFLKLTVYLTFFTILFMFYGLPIHILRDVVVTVRSFFRRILDFMRYRNATRDMNERYPDATVEEVAREEVCIICRETMTSWQQPAGAEGLVTSARGRISERLRPKKLPCGHILHFACLRSWLERQQNCPTCRRPVVVLGHGHGAQGGGAQDNRAPGLQANLPVGNQAAAADAAHHGGLPRARIFQFGPFRVGFGAGRGDLFHNIHQQIRQGNIPPRQVENANAPAARQVGFGFGFGRPPPDAAAVPFVQPAVDPMPSAADIQAQLQQIERRITQEISSLRVTADQLHLVRLLQAELHRLRNLQGNVFGSQALSDLSPSLPLPYTTEQMRHQFTPDPSASVLGAGDARLPEGLVLPQGWTLTPLQPAQQSHSQAVAPTATSTAPDSLIHHVHDTTGTPQRFPVTGNAENEMEVSSTPVAPVVHIAGQSSSPEDSQDPPVQPLLAPRSESPSQGWTHVTPNRPGEINERNTSKVDTGNGVQGLPNEEEASSSCKGKARTPTVEDAPDDGT